VDIEVPPIYPLEQSAAHPVARKSRIMSTSSSDASRFDPRRRRLCPDGACIGLLDDSGRCKVCGTVDRSAAGGAAPLPAAAPVPEDEVEEQAAAALETADEDPGAEDGGFDPRRRLCEDGACVGVVRDDGLCSVCGRVQGG
jgi:hypothetical protein